MCAATTWVYVHVHFRAGACACVCVHAHSHVFECVLRKWQTKAAWRGRTQHGGSFPWSCICCGRLTWRQYITDDPERTAQERCRGIATVPQNEMRNQRGAERMNNEDKGGRGYRSALLLMPVYRSSHLKTQWCCSASHPPVPCPFQRGHEHTLEG